MPSVRLRFPVLVKNIEVEGKMQYYLRPLFISHPVATHRRFEYAVHSFKREVKDYFKGFQLNRQNADKLLWFNFNPNLKYDILKIDFQLGNQFVQEHYGAAYFVLKGLCFVCLPAFNNYMFIAEKNEKGRFNIPTQVQNVVQMLLRKDKRNNGVAEPKQYAATKGEFVTEVDLYVRIENGKFSFEQSGMDWLFSRLMGGSDFVGSVEIEKVGYNLNNLYPTGLKTAYFRDEIVERLSKTIYQTDNTPLVIIGKEGVGKHSILHEAIRGYIESTENVEAIYKEILWFIDPTRIIAGMSIVGMWQKRFESILRFVQKRRKDLRQHNKKRFNINHTDKIVIDNAVALLRIGKSSQNDMTLSDVLKPYLEKRLIQTIIIATPEEWKVVQEKDRRFADLFQLVRLEEPEMEVAVKMVLRQRRLLELEHGGSIGNLAIAQLFNIHRNYFKRKALPGSVMKLLTQLAVKYKFQTIDGEEVRQEFEEYSGLHQEIFDATYTLEKGEIREWIRQRLIGQETAVECLADVIHVIKARLNNYDKPLGSFMFIGPTGVGKTEAAKILCNYLMGNEDALMRFDMNEYIDASAIQRLIGDYYNPEGQLTGKVRYRPFGVILFDEIEKAHPKVHDLLLQVLDDGRLTDSLGRTVDFTNTIIIMTSNVGARAAAARVGFQTAASDNSEIYRKSVENRFRPEFINRIDRIVIFQALKLEHILKIARLQINELLRRDGFIRRTTILNIDPKALEWVSKRGYNSQMGGRALKRQIETDLTALSADQLISTPSSNPIIFEISLENDKLKPNVIPLTFTEEYEEEWLPILPDEKQGRRFYGHLLRIVERLERRLAEKEEAEGLVTQTIVIGNEGNDNLDWQYYDFKNRIREVKGEIQDALLGFHSNYYVNVPVIPFRLKRVAGMMPRKEWHTDRAMIMDKMLQKDAIKQLSENYRFTNAQFDRLQTTFVNHFLDVSLLRLFSKGFIQKKVDKVVIQFTSCIANMGAEQIKFLMERYEEMLTNGLDIACKVNKKKQQISLEGHTMYPLLKGEAGIHIFYPPHQTPLPIKVDVIYENGDPTDSDNTYKVIRLYNATNMLTDIRTGFTNEGNISANEFKLLLYGGLDKELREEIAV